MKTMCPSLARKRAKENNRNQNEKGTNPQQHTGRVALNDAA
jgi:hypothetical protein